MNVPPGFDLHSVHIFVLTAELGGMTQCAEHFGTTQSAISQTISKLEKTLNTKLFDRAMRPMGLTASGKVLLADGKKLLSAANGVVSHVRDGDSPFGQMITIAMAESMASIVTAPFLERMRPRVANWQIRSGTSLMQHGEFLSRQIDLLITPSDELEDMQDLDNYPIMEEEFVLVFPAGYKGSIDPSVSLPPLPFIRYSLHSAIGQRTERQLSRLRLNLENYVEVDTTGQQFTCIGQGLGWGITTPLCLACHTELLPTLRVEPMAQGRFRRRFRLIVRKDEFGTIPAQVADTVRTTLKGSGLAPLREGLPWIADKMAWL